MKIQEIQINNERVFLKKGFFGWKVVKPIKIDDKINWKNLICGGSWFNLFVVFLIVIIILGCLYEYSIALKTANDCLLNNTIIINNSLPYNLPLLN